MKKMFALLLALVMVMSLAACGGSSKDDSAAFTTVESGKLIMATNAAFPPYEYYEGDKIVGIDAEIAQAIADKLGLELVIDDMEFDSIIEAVKGGKADMGLAGMTVTDERAEIVNFTASYATGVQVVIVAEGSAITSVDDMFADGAFTTIGVQRNTTGDLYTTWDLEDNGMAEIMRYSKGAEAIQALLTGKVDCVVIDNEPAKAFVAEGSAITTVDDLFAEGANHLIGVQRNTTGDLYSTWDLEDAGLATVDRYSKGADAVQALLTGKVDCVVIDNEPAKAFVEANEGLVILDTAYAVEDYAAAMNKDNAELYEVVNKALEELIADGTVASIVEKYIPAN